MRPRSFATVVLAALAAAVAPATAAHAAAPANDARADAVALGAPPSSVAGTTVGATVEATAEPPGDCGLTGPSVWYAVEATADARLIARLDADGDLDAVVDVFRRVRSQVTPAACDATDKDGEASAAFRVKNGERYLVRVAALPSSAPGTFHLDLAVAAPEPTAPGAQLPARGVTRTLDRVGHVADAFSARLRSGASYRVNLAALGGDEDACVSLDVYGPGTTSFDDDDTVRSLRCGGYVLLTPGPGEGGRYSFYVHASSRVRGAQRYHLQVARAGADDTAPGIFIHNFARVRGAVKGAGVDVVDLYRFDVKTRSTLFASLATRGALDLVLLRDDGRRLACACDDDGGGAELHRGLRPGRYFLAVRARDASNATYTLRRASRTITTSKILVDGRRSTRVAPGTTVRVAVVTAPNVAGPVTITIERFDPLSGWQFLRRVHTGGGAIAFTPPAVGRYRFSGSFDGTRGAAPSNTGTARLTVAGPLVE